MIYSFKNDNTLEYNTPLVDYLKIHNNYNDENLIYSKKYTEGTFSITNPTSEFKNAYLVNGYPHFDIPLNICLKEIDFFLNGGNMYNYNFYIRYGDLHPNKPIPKLGQLRNIILNNSLNYLILNNVKSFFPIGDISIKSIKSFKEKYNIDIDEEELFKMIVNDRIPSDIRTKFDEYNIHTINLIKNYLNNLNLPTDEFVMESSLYTNQKMYQNLKSDKRFENELKNNGELKYTLQELMFIKKYAVQENDVLINIIGANQSDHVLKVNEILNQINFNNDTRFLTYGMCYNADEIDYKIWSNEINKFIINNDIKINNKYITPVYLIKLLTVLLNNDNDIDFNKLNKYKNNIKTICGLLSNLIYKEEIKIEDNDLIKMMALVNYNINRAIEKGSLNYFYKYVLSIYKEYITNQDKYKNIQGLYFKFMDTCQYRLGLKEENSVKRIIK